MLTKLKSSPSLAGIYRNVRSQLMWEADDQIDRRFWEYFSDYFLTSVYQQLKLQVMDQLRKDIK